MILNCILSLCPLLVLKLGGPEPKGLIAPFKTWVSSPAVRCPRSAGTAGGGVAVLITNRCGAKGRGHSAPPPPPNRPPRPHRSGLLRTCASAGALAVLPLPPALAGKGFGPTSREIAWCRGRRCSGALTGGVCAAAMFGCYAVAWETECAWGRRRSARRRRERGRRRERRGRRATERRSHSRTPAQPGSTRSLAHAAPRALALLTAPPLFSQDSWVPEVALGPEPGRGETWPWPRVGGRGPGPYRAPLPHGTFRGSGLGHPCGEVGARPPVSRRPGPRAAAPQDEVVPAAPGPGAAAAAAGAGGALREPPARRADALLPAAGPRGFSSPAERTRLGHEGKRLSGVRGAVTWGEGGSWETSQGGPSRGTRLIWKEGKGCAPRPGTSARAPGVRVETWYRWAERGWDVPWDPNSKWGVRFFRAFQGRWDPLFISYFSFWIGACERCLHAAGTDSCGPSR